MQKPAPENRITNSSGGGLCCGYLSLLQSYIKTAGCLKSGKLNNHNGRHYSKKRPFFCRLIGLKDNVSVRFLNMKN
jgi:hypothetical protein